MTATASVQPPEVVERRIQLALRMIELGACVFPLARDSKKPLIPRTQGGRGFLDASPDPDRARTFLSNAGQPNYGLAFPEGSDVIVIDIDGNDDGRREGWQADWQRQYELYGPPGLSFLVRTPSGGRHAYYRWRTDLYGPVPPGDEMLGWTVRKPWKGYLVGPGSVVAGETYESIGIDSIIDLPESWARAALAEAEGRRQSSPIITVGGRGPAMIQAGHRHAYLRDQARHLVGIGLRGEALFAAVMDLNNQLAEPKTADDVRRAIGDAESKFEPDPVDPETGQVIRSASNRGISGRKQIQPPQIIPDLPFYAASAVATMTAEVIDWGWVDYLAYGTIAEIVGPPKAGKTTLVFALVRAYVEGSEFLGRKTGGGPVVILTEQGPTSLRAVLKRTDLAGRDDVHVLFHRDARAHGWPDVVATSIARCRSIGSRLLVVDTLPAFAGLVGDAENNAGDALEAMEPLQAATAEGIAVLVNRHRRKNVMGLSEGDIADEGRGSGAFSGSVDVILSLRRPRGGTRPTVREIAAVSRFDETPEKLVIEYTPDVGYVVQSAAAVETAETADHVASVLAAESDVTITRIVELTGRSRQTIQLAIEDLLKHKLLERTTKSGGAARKGNPYLYRLAPDFLYASDPPLRGEMNGSPGIEEKSGGPVGSPALELVPDEPPPAPSGWCRSFVDHQSRHRDVQTGSPWCEICSPADQEEKP